MKDKDFSKCQCPQAGWCDLLKKEMTATPPNWQWCQRLTEEERKKYHDKVNGKVRTIRKAIKAGSVDVVNFVDDIPTPKSDYAVCVIPANDSAMNLLEATRSNIQNYAKKCNADYVELIGDQIPEFPISNKFRLQQVTQRYKKTLFVDCDIVIKESAPDIFKITPNNKISAFDEFEVYLKNHRGVYWINETMHLISKKLGVSYRKNTMLNSGFMVIPKSCSHYYSQPEIPYPRHWCFDQMWLTLNTPAKKINKLGREWNNVFDGADFWKRFEESYVTHFNNMQDEESFHPESRKTALSSLSKNTDITEFELKTRSIQKVEEYDLPENMDEVEIVSVHFNPTKSDSLRRTNDLFLKGLKNVAPFIKCYEILFDDQEQEIEGSIIIRGSLEKNCLWQKEALLNVAINSVGESKKYFIWLDHDIMFLKKDWLKEAINKLSSGFDFCQLFSELGWADKTGDVHLSKVGRLAKLRDCERYDEWDNEDIHFNAHGNPGLCWAARVDSLKRMGDNPFPNAVVGSGDEYFCMGVTRTTKEGMSMMSGLMRNLIANAYLRENKLKSLEGVTQLQKYIDFMTEKVNDMSKYLFNSTVIDGAVYHFWHGDNKNRQYGSRHSIIQKCDLNLYEDVFINEDGIFELVENKYEASKRFYKFFLDRKED